MKMPSTKFGWGGGWGFEVAVDNFLEEIPSGGVCFVAWSRVSGMATHVQLLNLHQQEQQRLCSGEETQQIWSSASQKRCDFERAELLRKSLCYSATFLCDFSGDYWYFL